MNLHNDKEAFRYLLTTLSERTGVRADILEKDYYVTLLLKELSKKQDSVPAYFKGGTALYKALGTIRRFSEDIDLTVDITGCSVNQAKKRLESVSKKYFELARTVNKENEIDKKGSITSIYDYDPITNIDHNDPLQRFSHVKVEATSFTVSEPHEINTISSALWQYSNAEEKMILESNYDMAPFEINTITLERIFVDKVFASEFYYEKQDYLEASKHIYDIAVMCNESRIKKLLDDDTELSMLISYKRDEESRRLGSTLSEMPFEDFTIFEQLENSAFEKEYDRMQRVYVFDEKDMIDFYSALDNMRSLKHFFIDQDQTQDIEESETESMQMV